MMITENNYEEYFLLYIDDELTDAERSSVEAFIWQHPQYAAMLDALLQTKLPQDESILFSYKDALYKNANSEIGIDNYEEYFLLYTDSELSEKEKENTERFVLQHPQLQPEFTLLQQTRLPLEIIEYTGKEELYKKENKRRILPLYIVRMSVAAAVIGIIAFAWMAMPSANNSANDNNTIAANIKTTNKQVVKPAQSNAVSQQIKQPQQITTGFKQTTALQVQTKQAREKATAIVKTINNDKEKEKTEDVFVPVTTTDEPLAIAPTETALQKQTTLVDNKTETKTVAELKPLDVSDDETNTHTALSLSDDNNNIAQPAVYKELNTSDDDTHTLYVGAFQLNKAKVNGFLKSASRLLGSKAKQNAE